MSGEQGAGGKLAVVVPAFNEATVLAEVLADVNRVLVPGDELVVVDDGSADETAGAAATAGATVLRHPVNVGQGAALQTGIEYALGDPAVALVGTFDADGQHLASDLLSLRAKLNEDPSLDIVLGTRSRSEGEVPLSRRVVLRAGVAFTWMVTGVRLSDTHNGLRMMRRSAAEQVRLTMADMAHASELIALIGRHHLGWAEVPVTIRYTEYSRGKGQSLLNAINIGFDVIVERLIRIR